MSTGCTYERVVSDSWGDLRSLSEEAQQSRSRRSQQSEQSQAQWSILLESFHGPAAHENARTLAQRLRTRHNLTDVWVRREQDRAMLFRGRYAGPDDSNAQSLLRQSRLLRIDGNRPFRSAQLLVVGAPREGELPDLDLRRHSGMYSLQIAFFDEDAGPRFREAAEMYAAKLLQQGEQAFFYHGANRSLVTVGLFDDSDFVSHERTVGYGPRIHALQEKFPHNLGNGVTIIERVDGEEVGPQSSFLVRAP